MNPEAPTTILPPTTTEQPEVQPEPTEEQPEVQPPMSSTTPVPYLELGFEGKGKKTDKMQTATFVDLQNQFTTAASIRRVQLFVGKNGEGKSVRGNAPGINCKPQFAM